MTPFDPTQKFENPDGIINSTEQDDLIAFHLNELPRQQVRALRRALQTNPALQAESIAIAATLHAFPKHEPALPLDAAALDRHWRTLQPSLPIYTAPPIVPSSLFPHMFPRWAFPALAGSALVATTLLVAVHHSRHTQPPTIAAIATPSSSVPTLQPPASPQPQLPFTASPNAFNPSQQPTHSTWPPSSAPLETATAKAPEPLFPAQPPTPVAPTNPSIPTTEAPPPPPSNPAEAPPSAEITAQASTQSPIHSGRSRWKSPFHNPPATELTLAIFGDITGSRRTTSTIGTGTSATTESVSQTPGPAVGALGSVRQQFGPWVGYRVAVTYVSPSFESTGMNIYEFAGTYVVQGPHRGRLTTSAEAGAGLLDILTNPNFPTIRSRVFRPAAVIGVGSELALTRHWSVRAEVRTQLYKSPLLNSASLVNGSPTSAGSLTFNINPIVGVTYLFGRRSND